MLSTMEYRDWMMVAGAVLLVLRFIGFVFSQKKDADRTRNVRFKCEFDLSAGIDRCASFKIFETDPINVRYGGWSGLSANGLPLPSLMLWTAPPPARECHEWGCC